MAKKDVRRALTHSLSAEEISIQNRFEEADAVMSRIGEKKGSEKKVSASKVVRDSFTIPQNDYSKIAELRSRCLSKARNVTKSEIIRAGLNALEALGDEEFLAVVDELEKVKTGRPTQR